MGQFLVVMKKLVMYRFDALFLSTPVVARAVALDMHAHVCFRALY